MTADGLISFIQQQRWFGGKARGVSGVRIVDEGSLVAGRAWLAIVAIGFEDGAEERYFVPLAETRDGEVIVDALLDDEACRALVDVLEAGATVRLARGRLQASVGASRADGRRAASGLPVRRSGADQSNTSVVFGDALIMKAFRRVEGGINPDVEIGRFLTARGFSRVPPLVAHAEYVSGEGPASSMLMLQQYIPNQGNAWESMLADGGGASIALASTIGRRTGELHAALASDPDDPAFAPEPLDHAALIALAQRMRAFGARQLKLLRDAALAPSVRALAQPVLEREEAILAGFETLAKVRDAGARIRCHGDYHLGQTLVSEGDVFVLDFEGEPARPLAERREKSSPLRDVAGMLRSFSYAAETAGHRVRWEHAAADAFLGAYRAATSDAAFLPASREAFDVLLDAFVLDKTLYELAYELNNRPNWVHLPLAALLDRAHAGR